MRMSEGRGLPAGTLTFLFTDIEGSTKLQNELGTDRYQDVLKTHTRILREAFKDGGVEIRVDGDALFVVFPVAARAVRATAAAQRALGAAVFPHGATVRVRMGMHTGEGRPATADAGADYVGIDVNHAARVAAAGHGGQVLLTDATATLARPELGDGVSFRDLGEFRLKDLANPEHIYQLVISGCAADFPPLRTLDRTSTFLPAQPTTFIGRAREIAEGQRLLEKARLVTLTGPGGTGKTRLSLRIAAESAHDFRAGKFPVPPLDLPDPQHLPSLDELAQSDAVRLFIQRASAVRPDFRVTAENAGAVAEICNRLDGLPLAIELAAARVKVLTPQAMLPKLRQGLDMLASTARDLPERQRTLRGAIAWSWDLLSPAECKLFSRLAVFVAGGMLPQIEEVCGPAKELGGDVLDALSSLVEHSLIRQSEIEGEPRFRMLVTIREYALAKLAESGEHEDIAKRHALAFLGLAERSQPHLQGPEQKRSLDLLELEHDNLRAALETTIARAMGDEACRLISALWRFWQVRGHLVEGGQWASRVLALPLDAVAPLVRMHLYEAAGGMAYWRGELDIVKDFYSRALEIADSYGDESEQANAAYNLSFVFGIPSIDGSRTSLPRALELVRVARTKWTKAGDRPGQGRASWALAT